MKSILSFVLAYTPLFFLIIEFEKKGETTMRMIKIPNMKPGIFSRISFTVVAILFLLNPLLTSAEDKIVTQATLLDRIQIEDMIVKYYVDMSAGKSHDLSQYYTEDAVLDVNGVIAKGQKAIEKLYEG